MLEDPCRVKFGILIAVTMIKYCLWGCNIYLLLGLLFNPVDGSSDFLQNDSKHLP
jgi:hypothetical protein